MQNICQHTPPPPAAAAAAAADASQTQRRGLLQFAVTRKNGPCKIETPIHFRTTLIENTQPTKLLNIGITFDIFAQFTGWMI